MSEARHPLPFEALVAPARAAPALWRTGAGLALAAGTHLACLLLLAAAAGALAPGLRADLLQGRTPEGLTLILASFAGLAAGTVLAARLLHGRGAASLFGRAPRVIAGFAAGAAAVGSLYGTALLAVSGLEGAAPGLAPGLWLAWLGPALLVLLLQTGAEEMLFRGYLQTQLAARFRSPLAWKVLPSALFGLVHYDPSTFGATAWLVVAATGLFGLAAADLTARSGAIGWAWGFHFANNAVALLLLAPAGPLDGLALFIAPFPAHDAAAMGPRLLLDMAMIAAVWGVGRLLTR